MPPYRNYIYEYHAKITSGEIIAGKWIKKIYEIIINGLQKQEYFFNAKAANKAIRFMALCGLPVKKVWEKVREFLAKYTDELPDTDELDGDSTTGNVEEHRTQER